LEKKNTKKKIDIVRMKEININSMFQILESLTGFVCESPRTADNSDVNEINNKPKFNIFIFFFFF
jgi:hypothetical protein